MYIVLDLDLQPITSATATVEFSSGQFLRNLLDEVIISFYLLLHRFLDNLQLVFPPSR